MMDEEVRKEEIWDEHEWRSRTMRRLQDAWRVIRWQREQVEIDDMLEKRADEKEHLLRLYLELVETEEECSRLMSKHHGQEEFMVLVRAAAVARRLLERIAEERTKNGGFLKGIADAIDMRNARERVRTSSDSGPGGL